MPRLPGEADKLPIPGRSGNIIPGVRDPVGPAMYRAGSNIAGAANQLYGSQKRHEEQLLAAQQERDELDVEDKYNQAVMYANDLELGEDGYKRLKGEHAVNGDLNEKYSERLDSYIETVSNRMANDNRRELFKAKADILKNTFSGNISKHVMGEDGPYRKNLYLSTVETSIRQAALNIDNPGAIASSAYRMEKETERYARDEGLPEEWVQARNQKNMSDLVENVAISVLGVDPYKALEMLSAPVDGLDEDRRMIWRNKAMAEINRLEAGNDEYLDGLRAKGRTDFMHQMLFGEFNPRALQDAVEAEFITPEEALKWEKRSYDKGPRYDDEWMVMDYRRNLVESDPDEIAGNDLLTYSTRMKLLQEQQALVEDKSNWTYTQVGKEAKNRMDEYFGIYEGTGFLDQEKAQRGARASVELFDRIQSLPPSEREASVISMADEIILRDKQANSDDKVEFLTRKKGKNLEKAGIPYRTSEEVEQAFKQSNEGFFGAIGWGDMGEEERDELIRIIQQEDDKIKRAKDARPK